MRRLAGIVLAGAAWAQQFEVATVRQSDGPMMMAQSFVNGRFSAQGTLKELLIFAYDNPQVAGPDWITTTRYDIAATAPAGASRSDLPAMLRSLLAERLRISAHLESAERNVYALEVTRGGAKIGKLDPAKPPEFPKSGVYMVLSGSLQEWSKLLVRLVDRPVVNRTGIEGDYFHVFTFSVGDAAQPSLFTALTEQTGLRLTPARAVVETVVVDRAERVPTDN